MQAPTLMMIQILGELTDRYRTLTTGTDTQGVVLCHQMRSLDLKARRGKRLETLPDFIVEDVLAKLHAILD